jgi:hypothetical protein
MLMFEILRGGLAAIILTAGAAEQSDNYTSIDVLSEKPMQIGYHASISKECMPAAPPQIHVIAAPKFGTLSVRRAILTTGPTHACPNLKSPAFAIFYQSRAAYTGSDHFVYQVISAAGEIENYDITLEVKAPPEAKKEQKI